MQDPNLKTLVIPVTVTVDAAAYALDYGRSDDYAEFAAEIVRDAANERFKLLGWATVDTIVSAADPRSPQ
jgi:hypothetical protein